LRKSLALATSDVTRITKLRESRLACLEKEGLEFQARWSDALLESPSAGDGDAGGDVKLEMVKEAVPCSVPCNTPRSGSCSPQRRGMSPSSQMAWQHVEATEQQMRAELQFGGALQKRDPELTPDMEDVAQPAVATSSEAAKEQRRKDGEDDEASEAELMAEVALLPYSGADGGTVASEGPPHAMTRWNKGSAADAARRGGPFSR